MLDKSILDKGKLYIVAVSGGADSVALLLMMHDEGFRVEAAHCNFHLRGDEADRDEQFVVDLCSRLGVNLHRVHFDTREYAELHKQSIETAARNLRYAYFNSLLHDIGFKIAAVGDPRLPSTAQIILNLLARHSEKRAQYVSVDRSDA